MMASLMEDVIIGAQFIQELSLDVPNERLAIQRPILRISDGSNPADPI